MIIFNASVTLSLNKYINNSLIHMNMHTVISIFKQEQQNGVKMLTSMKSVSCKHHPKISR